LTDGVNNIANTKDKVKDNHSKLQLEFLKTVLPSSFSKFSCVSKVKYNVWDNFLCCRVQVISFNTEEGEKQNKINWTAMTQRISSQINVIIKKANAVNTLLTTNNRR